MFSRAAIIGMYRSCDKPLMIIGLKQKESGHDNTSTSRSELFEC